ncbi:MAG: helix-turn-helix domain-containing protein [Chloroflexota bacterium]
MDISEAAKASGLPASTLRFYEEKGLIQSIGRKGMRRVFDNSILDRLAFISLSQHGGFTLDEIRQFLTEDGPEIDRTTLLSKADEVDLRIQRLNYVRDTLRHVANCDAENHFDCPKFLQLLQLASKVRVEQFSIGNGKK